MPAPRPLPYTLDALYDFIDALEAKVADLEERLEAVEDAA